MIFLHTPEDALMLVKDRDEDSFYWHEKKEDDQKTKNSRIKAHNTALQIISTHQKFIKNVLEAFKTHHKYNKVFLQNQLDACEKELAELKEKLENSTENEVANETDEIEQKRLRFIKKQDTLKKLLEMNFTDKKTITSIEAENFKIIQTIPEKKLVSKQTTTEKKKKNAKKDSNLKKTKESQPNAPAIKKNINKNSKSSEKKQNLKKKK